MAMWLYIITIILIHASWLLQYDILDILAYNRLNTTNAIIYKTEVNQEAQFPQSASTNIINGFIT